MRALGFTLNNMTMLALSLATGIVIDDAIVVLENIFRYIEEKGVTPKEAAIKATREIGLAVMATTLSLVVIFVPVAFMTGQVGRYFYSFGITSAAAILLSMFVSFTLTPALCALVAAQGGRRSRTRSDDASSSGVYAWIDRHVRPDARVVAARTGPLMLGHRRARSSSRPRSSTRTSARNSCPTTTRASSASTSGCPAARASIARSST